jgi:hypothetical protein
VAPITGTTVLKTMQGMTTYQGLPNKCICSFNVAVGLCNFELRDFGRQERTRSWPLPRQTNEEYQKKKIRTLVLKYERILAGSVVVVKILKL